MVEMNRRHLLFGGISFFAATSLLGGLQQRWRYGAPVVLGTVSDAQGQSHLLGIDSAGDTRFCIRVPHPAHSAIAVEAQGIGIYFSQRPGRLMYIVDLRHGQLLRTVELPAGLALSGRGALSEDGALFFTSELDLINGAGLIGIYEAQAPFRRMGQIPSNGVAPADVMPMKGSPLLAVANSGLRSPTPLRTSTAHALAPNLSYLDSRDGTVTEEVKPPQHLLSPHHLAATPNQGVVIAVEDLSPTSNGAPLLFSHQRGEEMKAIIEAEPAWQRMNQHIAGLATSSDGQFAVSTAPRGEYISLWHIPSATSVQHFAVADAANVTWREPEQVFLISNSQGNVILLRPGPTPRLELFAAGPAPFRKGAQRTT